MDSTFVVDASILLKWYLGREEPHWRQANLLLDRFKKGEVSVLIPEYALYELANRFAQEQTKGVEWFLLAATQFSDRAPSQPEFIAQAMKMAMVARQNGIRKATVYDALYVQLAKMTEFPLLTADRVQGQIGESANIKVKWLWGYE